MMLANGAAVADKPLTLDAVVRRVHDISTLPHIITKVIEVANEPDSSAIDMKEVIETDPALSARVLRYVNSSACGLRERVSNLLRAISYLGMRQVRSLVLTASVAELFAKDEAVGSYRRRGLWEHLVAVGICARLIAMRKGIADFEDAFVAGLLHDIGIVLEDQYLHEHFCGVIESLASGAPLVQTEQARLGFDHARLGAKVAENWRFSERVKAAIGYHHNSSAYRGEEIAIVRCVEMANIICTLKGYTSVGQKLIAVSQPLLKALSLTREHLAVLAKDLDGELIQNAALFEM